MLFISFSVSLNVKLIIREPNRQNFFHLGVSNKQSMISFLFCRQPLRIGVDSYSKLLSLNELIIYLMVGEQPHLYICFSLLANILR